MRNVSDIAIRPHTRISSFAIPREDLYSNLFDNGNCNSWIISVAFFTGHGRLHYEIATACAFCLLATGFQNGLPAYIFPAAQCSLKLTSSEIGFLNAAFLIGATFSAFFWGVIADLNGRRKVLIYSLFLDFCVTFVSAFMTSFNGFFACRFLNGFLIGAPGSVTFTYLAEFQAPKNRMRSVCYSGIFFTLSWLLLPVISYFILPLHIRVPIINNLNFTQWRLFLILVSIPEFVVCLWFIRLPESPKFLECKGDPRRALIILRRMYACNTGKDPNEFPVKNLKCENRIETDIAHRVKVRGKTMRVVQEVWKQIQLLFRPPLMWLTILMGLITFCNMFG